MGMSAAEMTYYIAKAGDLTGIKRISVRNGFYRRRPIYERLNYLLE